MANRNAKVWLAKNIKMDKDYRNVLKISESDMITLMSNNSNLVYYDNHYSFLRENENEIYVQASYGTCIQANYIAFQNPDYSNKIFFGFIDDVIYENEYTTRIRFTIDVWTTWYNFWSSKACFVVREHVQDDTIGANTVPENIETGEYVSCMLQPSSYDNPDLCFVIACTEQVTTSYDTSTLGREIPDGLYYYGFTTTTGVKQFIKYISTTYKPDFVHSIFVAYKDFFSDWTTFPDIQSFDGQISSSLSYNYSKLINVTKVNYVGMNYVPKNNKLFVFPYSFLQVSNHAGQIITYKWERFNKLTPSDTNIKFSIKGTITPGCSIIAFPVDYNNIQNDVDESINVGKLPIGSWTNDTFTNWLTQNGVNLGMNVYSSALNAIASGNLIGGVIGVGSSIVSSIAQVYQHSLLPDSINGNTNCGDINYCLYLDRLDFKRMSVNNEYAKIIDDYFTRQGYKINQIKVPNMSHRQNYNYVQIADDDNVAYPNNHNNICPPPKDMDAINKLFRRGVTMWNNHSNLGDYSVSNNITS